jgi:transposase
MEKINKVEQCFKQTKKELYKILEYPIKKRWRKKLLESTWYL